MTVDTVYQIWLYAISKNLQQGYGSPDDFNLTINQGQKSYSSYLLGSFQTYTPGRPIAMVELGQNATVRQRLAPTIYGYNLNVDNTGFAPYPEDYLQTDAMWGIYGYQRIRYVQQNYAQSVYNSKIDPYQKNPFYLIEDIGFRFYPQSLGSAKLSYVRNPPDMIWGYDDDENGVPIYNAAKSTQPIWDDVSMLEIIIRALAIVGVNLQLGVVSQYAEMIKKEGQ